MIKRDPRIRGRLRESRTSSSISSICGHVPRTVRPRHRARRRARGSVAPGYSGARSFPATTLARDLRGALSRRMPAAGAILGCAGRAADTDPTRARVLEFPAKIGTSTCSGLVDVCSDPTRAIDAPEGAGTTMAPQASMTHAADPGDAILAPRPATPPDAITTEQSDSISNTQDQNGNIAPRPRAEATRRTGRDDGRRYQRSVGDGADIRRSPAPLRLRGIYFVPDRHRHRRDCRGRFDVLGAAPPQGVAVAGEKRASTTAPRTPPAAKAARPRPATAKDGDLAPASTAARP